MAQPSLEDLAYDMQYDLEDSGYGGYEGYGSGGTALTTDEFLRDILAKNQASREQLGARVSSPGFWGSLGGGVQEPYTESAEVYEPQDYADEEVDESGFRFPWEYPALWAAGKGYKKLKTMPKVANALSKFKKVPGVARTARTANAASKFIKNPYVLSAVIAAGGLKGVSDYRKGKDTTAARGVKYIKNSPLQKAWDYATEYKDKPLHYGTGTIKERLEDMAPGFSKSSPLGPTFLSPILNLFSSKLK